MKNSHLYYTEEQVLTKTAQGSSWLYWAVKNKTFPQAKAYDRQTQSKCWLKIEVNRWMIIHKNVNGLGRQPHIHLLAEDISFIKAQLSSVPDSQIMPLLKKYCAQWQSTQALGVKLAKQQNDGRYVANTWLRKEIESQALNKKNKKNQSGKDQGLTND